MTTNPPPLNDERVDVLISRMIDGCASDGDCRAFAHAADERLELWRELALRQRDAALLATAVERRLHHADRIGIPAVGAQAERESIPFPSFSRKQTNWLFATAGWAAALALLILWRLASPYGAFDDSAGPHFQNAVQTTPEEQLRSYLQAPYVLGQLESVMEQVDELPDGRRAVVAVRRIQEVLFLDEHDALPVDEERYFTKDPAELRTERQ